MFVGFNLSLNDASPKSFASGHVTKALNSGRILDNLEKYILNDDALDGTKMGADWFPDVPADIFISHSHHDEEIALGLAGWLEDSFGLDVFVDSSIWGNANSLLKLIDRRYCLNDSGDTFNYESRNYSTSHIHMLLSVALNQMIDKAECLIFLNTPRSITASETVRNQTKSPWIYSELAFSKIVRRQEPLRSSKELKEHFNQRKLTVFYDVSIKHLYSLTKEELLNWKTQWRKEDSSRHALDLLYQEKLQKSK